MSDRIWLASYPKSGNTWLRAMIGGLSLREGQALDINDIPGGIASARGPFDEATLIDSALLSHDEIDRLRPLVYAEPGTRRSKPNRGDSTLPVEFVKAHDAYTLTPAGVPLFGGDRAAKAAILVLRDPRDVVPSLANHNRSTIDKAIDYMGDTRVALNSETDRPTQQFRQKLMGWSGHAASWLDQCDIPLHVVRYEDMKRDAAAALGAVMRFVGCDITNTDCDRAASLAQFENLRALESAAGFAEWSDPNGRRFFRRGEAGAWRDELTPEQVGRIEAAHAPMMMRLGYDLATTTGSRQERVGGHS